MARIKLKIEYTITTLGISPTSAPIIITPASLNLFFFGFFSFSIFSSYYNRFNYLFYRITYRRLTAPTLVCLTTFKYIPYFTKSKYPFQNLIN